MPNTVLLKGTPIRKEGVCAASGIRPGYLLEFDASEELQAHGTAGANASPRFAMMEDYVGSEIETVYLSGETIPYVVCRPGDEVFAFLASGQNVSHGDFLESDGLGALQAVTNQSGSNIFPKAIVGAIAEDKNNTGDATGPAGATRIRLEVV